jgi:hypothetical protein
MSIRKASVRHHVRFFFSEWMDLDVENLAADPTPLQTRYKMGAHTRGEDDMKYILLMTGTKEGVDAYRAWSEKDIQTHFAYLTSLCNDLGKSGEFVATERLGMPQQAKVVRAGKDRAPITDGVFPEAKEFVLGYWIVDVDSAERAYEIAARISGGPGPAGTQLSMPIEVRQIMSRVSEELP